MRFDTSSFAGFEETGQGKEASSAGLPAGISSF